MLHISDAQFKNVMGTVPAALYDAAVSEETINAIERVVSQNNLKEKTGGISAVVGYVLLGFIPVRLIVQGFLQEAGISQEGALKIAQDIRREILAPVARDLAAIQPQAEQNYAALQATQNQGATQ